MSRLSILSMSAAVILAGVTASVRAQAPQGVQNQGQAQQAASLPDGAAKELVAWACTTCHGINQITNSTGYTKERWQPLFSTMIKLPDPQADSVAQYLPRISRRSRDVNRCWCQARCRSRSGNGRCRRSASAPAILCNHPTG